MPFYGFYLIVVFQFYGVLTLKYEIDGDGVFQNLVVDKNTGAVYIGGLNKIYHLSEDLQEIRVVKTGPRDDNPNCPPTGPCPCPPGERCQKYVKTKTNCVSKAITIDYKSSKLLSCSNLYQGHCEKRSLNDIRKESSAIWTPIVSNDKDSSVVLFVAPGPIPNQNVLYVAATRSTQGLSAYKDLIPAVSARSVVTFDLAYEDVLSSTRKDLERQQRDIFRVKYVYGFSSQSFSYFLAIQRDTVQLDVPHKYSSRIIRVCQNDKYFYSYAEIPLECKYNGKIYNLVRAAVVATPGATLARNLSLPHIPPYTDKEDVLFALFSQSQSQSDRPLSDAVLCVFSLQEIRRRFTQTIQGCFKGTGNTGPAHIVQPSSCISAVSC